MTLPTELSDLPDFEAALDPDEASDSDVREWLASYKAQNTQPLPEDRLYRFLRERFETVPGLVSILKRWHDSAGLLNEDQPTRNLVEQAVQTQYPDFDRKTPIYSEAHTVYHLLLSREWWT